MKRANFDKMTAEQLLQRFVDISLDQHISLLLMRNAADCRLFNEMLAIVRDLRDRPGDQRRVLIPLLQHPNAQVRMRAAHAALSLAPEATRRTFQIIAHRNELPQAPDAHTLSLHDALPIYISPY